MSVATIKDPKWNLGDLHSIVYKISCLIYIIIKNISKLEKNLVL